VTIKIIGGDCRLVMANLQDQSVNCCVTSPPYFGLRDYGVDGQMGLEKSPDEYIAGMVAVFREVRRVLRDDGTLWLNIGDSYAGSWGAQSRGGSKVKTLSAVQIAAHPKGQTKTCSIPANADYKAKDVIGIPWMLAFALRADGWYLRQDIIWAKPNPMPESVTDRCTKSHEYLFLLSKSPRYYFDHGAIAEPLASSSIDRLSQPNLSVQAGSYRVPGKTNGPMKAVRAKGNRRTFRGGGIYTSGKSFDNDADACNDSVGNVPNERDTRNKRSVWNVATHPFSDAHFATFPPALIEPCILAGCPAGGMVLDPFAGAGTTGLVTDRLGRDAILIELNPEYASMAHRRITSDCPLFSKVAT